MPSPTHTNRKSRDDGQFDSLVGWKLNASVTQKQPKFGLKLRHFDEEHFSQVSERLPASRRNGSAKIEVVPLEISQVFCVPLQDFRRKRE
jgi:hypothetical protein